MKGFVMNCAPWGREFVCVAILALGSGACETADGRDGGWDFREQDTQMEAYRVPKIGDWDFGPDGEGFQQTKGIEWLTTVASSEDTPDLADAEVRLFIPENTVHARGVLVFSRNGVGGWEYEQAAWREAAAAQGLVLVDIELRDLADRVTPWESADQSAIFLDRMFSLLSVLSGHAELETAPLFFFGHSAGAFWFTRLIPLVAERTAGFIAFQGSLACDGLFAPSTLAIPGLFLIAEYDPIWIRTDTSANVEKGVNNGALWSLFVQPDAGHQTSDRSFRSNV